MADFQSKFSEKITFHIDYFDFIDLLEVAYGKQLRMNDGHNGDIYQVVVPDRFYDKGHCDQRIQKILLNEEYEQYMGDLQTIFSDLYQRGSIRQGIYYVHVSW